MSTQLEVLRYGVPDGQGDVFSPCCFGSIEGTYVTLSLDFDPRKILGRGILHEHDNSLWVEIEEEVLAKLNFSPAAAIGGVIKRRILPNQIKLATLTEIALVKPEHKTPMLLKQEACLHERTNEDGICRACGADCRGIY